MTNIPEKEGPKKLKRGPSGTVLVRGFVLLFLITGSIFPTAALAILLGTGWFILGAALLVGVHDYISRDDERG